MSSARCKWRHFFSRDCFRAARPAANNSVASLWLLISRVAARKKCGRAMFRMVPTYARVLLQAPLPLRAIVLSPSIFRPFKGKSERWMANGRRFRMAETRQRRIALREFSSTLWRRKWKFKKGLKRLSNKPREMDIFCQHYISDTFDRYKYFMKRTDLLIEYYIHDLG